jgi:O-antigen/teichoic acid export membrane protein
MLHGLLKTGLVYTLTAVLSRGLAFLLLPIYTRVLSPADYGSLDLLIVFAAIINLTVAFEISQGVARFYTAEAEDERKILYASSAFWFTVLTYGIFLMMMLLFSSKLAGLIMGQLGHERAFQLGMVYIFTNGIFNLIQNQLRWEFRSFQHAILNLLMTLVTIAVSIWLGYILGFGLDGLLVGMIAGSFGANVLGLYWLRASFRLRWSVKLLGEMLQFSTPLVAAGIVVWVNLYLDRLMISHFMTIADVGLYSVGYRLASISSIVTVGLQWGLTPLIYAHFRESRTPKDLEKIFRVFIFVALLAFLCLTLFSSDVLHLMTTPGFYGASDVVIFLVPSILFGNMVIFSPGIYLNNKTHLIVWIVFSGALLNLSLNYLLIPVFGIQGAGAATLASQAFVFGVHTFAGLKLYPVPHHWGKICVAVSAGVAIAIVLPQLSISGNLRWLVNFLGISFFIALTLGIGLIKRQEVFAGLRLIGRKGDLLR